MKNLKNIFLLLMIMAVAAVSVAQNRPIIQYIFEIDQDGEQQEMVVSVIQSAPDLVFDYKIAENKGRVTLKPAAMKTSNIQVLDLEGGDLILTDKNAVWMSTRNYEEFKKGSTIMDFGEGKETLTLVGKEDFELLLKGKRDKVKALKGTTDKGREVWIMDDSKNPVIIMINKNGKVTLKEII